MKFAQRTAEKGSDCARSSILPVVFLAVILVGAFGWVVFTRYAVSNLVENDSKEVAFLMENLRQKALVETMGLHARKGEIRAENAAATGTGRSEARACREWTSELLSVDFLAGVAQVGNTSPSGEQPASCKLETLCFVDSLSGPINASRLLTWFEGNREYFKSGFRFSPAQGAPSPGAPAMTYADPWHATYVFPPVLIEEFRNGSQASAGGDLAALLPVLVREETEHEQAHSHTVYFLSLNRMLTAMLGTEGPVDESDSWWSVVNHQGRVIAASGRVPTVGSLLQNQHRTADHGPFAVVSGEDLVGNWALGEPWKKSLFGNQMNHWVVTAGQSRDFPLALLIGHEARDLKMASLGYVAAVVGMALLALAIAIFGVTRVVGGVSSRLRLLSENMEQVAEGDYTRRIAIQGHDEVGRLINYFNLMAVSLDDTQRELTEKTSHLEAALENRQLLDRAKDDFLVLISHEVRTPLTAIMGGVNILKSIVKRTVGSDRAVLDKLDVIEVVKIIDSSGERLHGFMNDAIQMTSIQSSDKELNLKCTSINGLVEMGLCGVRELATIRNIEVVNGLDSEQDWLVLCDERVMKLAFEKILKNAVVHNYDEGRVMIREVEEVPEQGRLGESPRAEDVHRLISQPAFEEFADLPLKWRLVEIFNTGEAIPEERREALFGKFELVGRIEHHQRGSGLSLPIARSAIENHGGRVCVHSVKLQGNSFFILLPTVLASAFETIQALPGVENAPASPARFGQQTGDGVVGGSSDEGVGQVADLAGLKVEFDHQGPTLPSSSD